MRLACSIAVLLLSATLHSQPLPKAGLDGNYFSRSGNRFIPIGAHWIPAKAGLQWPVEWNPADIEADFARMRELGFNTVRLDLFWGWFEPRPGDYNAEAFKQLDFLISLAHRYGIYLHPSLFIGGEVGEAYWDVPWRNGRHPHADPEMLRLQTEHAAEFARRYRGETAILAWDLTDEPPFWIVRGKTTDAMAINWTRLIAGAIRRFDLLHPLCVGTDVEDIGHGPFRPDNIRGEVDFFSVHPYPIYNEELFPDSLLSERVTYCPAFQTALSRGAKKPVMVQELGASSAQYDPDRIAMYDRVSLYSALGAGANGFLLWCYTDAAPEQFRRAPYVRAPHETQFGLTAWDRKDRPRAKEFRAFARLLSQLDLGGLDAAPADAGIVVPYGWSRPWGDHSRFGFAGGPGIPYVSTQEGGAVAGMEPNAAEGVSALSGAWLSAFITARRAGVRADFPREQDGWETRPMILLPSPLTGTRSDVLHVQTPFWEKVRSYVRKGGFVYASVSGDAAIPEMEELFGARLEDREPANEVVLSLVAPLGGLKPGEKFRYAAPSRAPQHWAATLKVARGEVIAVDQAGRPALIANSYGAGKTLLCAYPLESYLAATTFDSKENTYRLYRAFREWAGIRPLFETDQPSVEIDPLKGERGGYAVVANHSPERLDVTITASASVHQLQTITAEGRQPLRVEGRGWRIAMEPFGGAVLAWK